MGVQTNKNVVKWGRLALTISLTASLVMGHQILVHGEDTTHETALVQSEGAAMSQKEKERAIAQMGSNQGDVWVWSADNVVPGQSRGPNGGAGQFNGGAVVMGGRPSYDPPADWYYLAFKKEGMSDDEARAIFEGERGKFMNEFDPWGVVLEMSDNTATNVQADVRNMKAFFLREGETTWQQVVDHPEAVQWVNQFKGNMHEDTGPANNSPATGGGTTIEILPKQDRVAHWGSNQIRHFGNPETIRAVLVSVEARVSDKSDPNAKIGIQVGGDWKFTEEISSPLWYPGAGLAGIQRLSNEWERYYFVSITGVQDAVEERAISPEVFQSTVVPLADLSTPKKVPEPTPPSDSSTSTTTTTSSSAGQDSSEKNDNQPHTSSGQESGPSSSIGKGTVKPHQGKLPNTGSEGRDWYYSILGLIGLGLVLASYFFWKKRLS